MSWGAKGSAPMVVKRLTDSAQQSYQGAEAKRAIEGQIAAIEAMPAASAGSILLVEASGHIQTQSDGQVTGSARLSAEYLRVE